VTNFDETLAYIDRIQKARSPEEICRTVIDITSRFGLTALSAGIVSGAGSDPGGVRAHVLLCEWPVGWRERYVAMNHVAHDPLVAFMKRSPSAVYWRDALACAGADPGADRVCDEARSFRLNDGFALAFATVEGETVIVSLGGEEMDLPQQAVGLISLTATFAVGRAMQLAAVREEADPRPGLTDREKECMQWAALGKSEWEISQILGISEHTSGKHLQSAKTKLRAANRVQAVAEAIRQGYIS